MTALAASVLGTPLAAQTRPAVISSIDLSATSVTYADSVHASGVSVTPAFRVDWTRATIGGSATLSQLSHGGSSVQASLAPSVFTPNLGPFTAELAGALGGSTHNDGSRTGQFLGVARVYAIGDRRGAWAGAAAGRNWDGVVWRDVRQAELGGWLVHRDATALASVTPVIVQDSIRYTDVQSAVRYPTGNFELGATGGFRVGASGPAIGGTSRAWGSLTVVAWFARRLAVVASAGSYPVDLSQGYPGGRFVTLALRAASPNARPTKRESAPAANVRTAEERDELAFEVGSPGADSLRELRVFAPAATTVEITGDFTGWRPLRLTRSTDGWWSTSRRLAPGTYQMNLRTNGGPWVAPPGLLVTRDEFGGTTGILTIE